MQRRHTQLRHGMRSRHPRRRPHPRAPAAAPPRPPCLRCWCQRSETTTRRPGPEPPWQAIALLLGKKLVKLLGKKLVKLLGSARERPIGTGLERGCGGAVDGTTRGSGAEAVPDGPWEVM
eukprot:363354-Chlamydomonas_euryale.AAC.6